MQEHELLRSGTDQNVIGVAGGSVTAPLIVGDRFAQRVQAPDRQILLACRVLPKGVDDGVRDGEGRLSETEPEDLSTLCAHPVATLVDCHRCGRL